MRDRDIGPSWKVADPAGQCVGKETHDSAGQAKKVVRNMRRFGKTVIAYRCLSCQLWHVGRPSPRLR